MSDTTGQWKPVRAVRRALFAGLLVVVPLGVTAWVLYTLVDFFDRVVGWLPVALQPETWLGRSIPGLGILLALAALLLVGASAENIVGRRLVLLYEALISRVPGVSAVYVTVKQLVEQLTGADRGFEEVVLVQWPRHGTWAVGFLTGSAFVQAEGVGRMVNVFLPTTPNPTTGFYFMVAEDEVVPTGMTVEEAFKLLMSAGIVEPSRLALPPDRRGER